MKHILTANKFSGFSTNRLEQFSFMRGRDGDRKSTAFSPSSAKNKEFLAGFTMIQESNHAETEESSVRSVLNIHDSHERRCQQSRKLKCEGYIFILKVLSLVLLLLLSVHSFAENATIPQQPQQQPSDLQQKIQRLQRILAQAQRPTQQNVTSEAIAPTTGELAPTAPQAIAPTPGVTLPVAGDTDQAQVQQMQPKEQKIEQPDLYEEAFSGVVNQLMPMSPEQIGNLKATFNSAQRAAATPVGVPPRPTSSSVLVNLAPHATPPIIRLQAGYITSLVFVDSTGQPWPISAYSLGDPTAFNIQWDKKGNTLLVQSLTFYKRSNIAVILKDLNTPVMLSLLPGQEAVDYRVDLRVPGLGPNAIFSQNGLPESTNPMLIDVLNGIPPPNSITLNVIGGDCQAWLNGGSKLFLRTNLDVISPAFKAKITSIDGTHAYEIQRSPRVLVLQRGKIETLKIEGI